MWDQNQSFDGSGADMGAGGFMKGDKTPGGEKGKRQRVNNIVPVWISDIKESTDEHMTVEDKEVGMVVLVGQVRAIDKNVTKTVFKVQDKSGEEIDCVHWVDEEKEHQSTDVDEQMFCRVIGAVRTNQEKKSVMVFRISPVTDMAEVDAHSLEITYAKLKLRQLKEKENASIYGNNQMDTGLSNSMVQGYSGAGVPASTNNSSNALPPDVPAGAQAFASNSNHLMTFKMLKGCAREEGMSVDEVFEQLKGKISRAELDKSVAFLSDEGHIYSTIDDNHYAVIEA